MTLSLRELQENFQSYVLDENNHIFKVISSENNNAVERIDIYKKGYVLRLLEILEKDFPILYKRLGKEQFEKIGREFINRHPSDQFSVCLFSRHFSQFLLDAQYETFWSEMAAFEWALSCALVAADGLHIGLAELSTVLPENWPFIQFDFHPSVEVYKFRYNAPQITHAMMEGQEVPDLIELEQPVSWAIWRYQLAPYFESLTQEQVWMIHAIRDGKNFGEICEGLCKWLPEEEVALFAAGSLRNWLEKGLFSAIKIEEPQPA